MTYSLLASGERYTIGKPDQCSFDIDDIAIGLARTCRFNGQFSRFEDSIYNVAEHSLIVDDIVHHFFGEEKARPWGLMHDAPESIIGDMITPVKRHCPNFEVEEELMAEHIRDLYDIPFGPEIQRIVHKADMLAFAMEAEALTGKSAQDWGFPRPPISLQQLYGDNWAPMGVKAARDAFKARASLFFGV